MRIALPGSTGYIGQHFVTELALRGHTCLPIRRSECDVYDVDTLTKHLDDLSPDFLINCAGYTGKPNIDACELHKAECLAGNAVLPGVIAQSCQQLNLPWGHVASGCIFTGWRDDGGGFTEADPPNFTFRQNNCSFYSGTKALGEEILSDAEQCYLWRLRIPFSAVDSPRNYLSKLMTYERLLDVRNSLSYLPEFVTACLDCCQRQLPFGIYNLTNPGSVTTREVIELIRDSGIVDKQFKFFTSESEFMRQAATAPRSNCVLDSSKATQAGLKLSPVEEAIKHCLIQWTSASNESDVPSDGGCLRSGYLPSALSS